MKHLEVQVKDLSQQFTDQIKALESKVVVDTSILNNIHDLYKRRAIIEQDYADNLLKLTSSISQKKNCESLRRPKWKNHSSMKVLNSLLVSTERTAKAHKNLGEIYGKQMTLRISDMQEDCSRLTKRSTDILQRRHAEILKSFGQLLIKQKKYCKVYNDTDDTLRKANKSVEQLNREVIRCQDKKRELEKNPKIKKFKEDYMEKYKFFNDKQVEATKSRNKYIVHLLSLKDSIEHFYSSELHTIIQCTQYGFHNNLTRLSMNHESSEDALVTVHSSIGTLFKTTVDDIDATCDTKIFFEAHKSVFNLKEDLQFNSAKDDNICNLIKTEQNVEKDLRYMHIKFVSEMKHILNLMEDRKCNLDVLSNSYNDLINQTDYDVVDYVCSQSQSDHASKERLLSIRRDSVQSNLYSAIQKRIKEPKQQKEIAYFKFMEIYLNDQINMINVGTKLKHVESALNGHSYDHSLNIVLKSMKIHPETASIIGMKSKLFGGDLKKYSSETNEMVPLIVRSCIRLINLYGMRNVGVFRVPGSQTDVQLYKVQFELGSDPLKVLSGSTDDVNLASSLLKLYFRELDPAIFDEAMFTKIVENYTAVKQKEGAIAEFMRSIVETLNPAVYSTVVYLVSFLKHLSEFSAENCMDILNLAIIFGPCLMPIPEDQNCQLFHFQAIINHVTQCLITYRDNIFTRSSDGPIYCRNQSTSTDQSTNIDPGTVQLDNSTFFDEGFSCIKEKADSISLKKQVNELWVSGSVKKTKSRSFSDILPSSYINIFSIDEHNDKKNNGQNLLTHCESNKSSPETQVSSRKEGIPKKISLPSMDSDNDLECSSQSGPLVGNTFHFSDNGDFKSLESIENFPEVNTDDYFPEKNKDYFPEESCDKVDKEMIRIRTGSLVRSPDSWDTTNIVDDDLRQTMQGLQKIEQMNVIKHRNTITIDRSLLTSKFISPIQIDRPIICPPEMLPKSIATDVPDDDIIHRFDFPLKKYEDLTYLPSTLENSYSPSIVCHSMFTGSNISLNQCWSLTSDENPIMTSIPPLTYPKPPKDNKK